ncbi:capsular biosynthesis protein [Sphingobium sp. Leaf26]|uniref:polysaccharide biosynthesis/export family protein n=1 Tax=Sphingobium sp. Leaf26 TaxID=1735693 RepID=UPI0006F3F398|nr:polysaccharide biosynthesis/export family protein [Sphingobium sp. Leaf26]KQN06606.1 capsular biosynthesis protein [Sphingobium sp. Leaf26]
MNRLIQQETKRPRRHAAALLALLMLTSACTSVGPGRQRILNAPEKSSIRGIEVINLEDGNSPYLTSVQPAPDFATSFGQSVPIGQFIGKGDTLQIAIWEAPPAVLFGGVTVPGTVTGSQGTPLPDFLVGDSGMISVPFAGSIQAAGRTLTQIEQDIAARLRNKAHLPQVTARLAQNAASTATVVGEVTASVRMPLTAKGETILDGIAASGGTRQLADKITVQLTRNGQSVMMPLQSVIRDPRQNIILRPGDVVTALFQPFSFTTLGAVKQNAEVPFESTGLTLSQAMGRAGGLLSADPKGVFIFRWEDAALFPNRTAETIVNAEGKVPVIFRVDMKNPSTYFTMQRFQIRDKDVIYVANSPISEFQRFVGIMASTIIPVVSVDNALSRN